MQPEIDFERRADPQALPELMDGPCTYQEFRDCVRDIAQTTRLTLAYASTLHFVRKACSGLNRGKAVHIVDVGSGGGDVLRRIAASALQQHRSVELTGIDLNPYGTRAALEFSSRSAKYAGLRWITGDVFDEKSVQDPDLVLSSLVTHHMRDEEIIRFLRWMEEHARLGWFISDLVRSARSYRLFSLLSRVMRWHPFVCHDGLVSIRRGFRESDWKRLLAEAGVPDGAVAIRRCALGRLCLIRLRSSSTD